MVPVCGHHVERVRSSGKGGRIAKRAVAEPEPDGEVSRGQIGCYRIQSSVPVEVAQGETPWAVAHEIVRARGKGTVSLAQEDSDTDPVSHDQILVTVAIEIRGSDHPWRARSCVVGGGVSFPVKETG